jgi:hypothetical protein
MQSPAGPPPPRRPTGWHEHSPQMPSLQGCVLSAARGRLEGQGSPAVAAPRRSKCRVGGFALTLSQQRVR